MLPQYVRRLKHRLLLKVWTARGCSRKGTKLGTAIKMEEMMLLLTLAPRS